jgi:hypothetical protein
MLMPEAGLCLSTLRAYVGTVNPHFTYESLKLLFCGDRYTPLVNSQTSCMYPGTLVESLYISCYVSNNKLMLS